ncbi:hypothetical protein GGQ98_000455 [Sphingosinicella soli]|uniref:Uncharacterized protein n=1 Tax=Sphingosinicella soli TaxID=333708 RepID=A0A7W7AYR7_9SPHN|nr:hypothetical protein [Sphingosinicella soli]
MRIDIGWPGKLAPMLVFKVCKAGDQVDAFLDTEFVKA